MCHGTGTKPLLIQERMPMLQEKMTPEHTDNTRAKITSHRKAFSIAFFLIVIVTSSLDLGTKNWMFGRLGMPGTAETLWVWDGVFGFQTALNEGALFGMGQGFVLGFAILSFAMLIGIVIWLLGPFFKNWFLVVVMGLMSGGIIGNLYDRLGLHQLRWLDDGTPVYAVRDWILVMIGSYHWPNFNLADSYLVAGVILLGIYVFFFVEQPKEKPNTSE
jgi:signal peptidase II